MRIFEILLYSTLLKIRNYNELFLPFHLLKTEISFRVERAQDHRLLRMRL